MSNKQELAGKSASIFMKTRFVLSFVLLLMIGAGGYYFLHVQRKSDYLVSRNFRLLTAMGERIAATVDGQGTVLANLTKKADFMANLDDPRGLKADKGPGRPLADGTKTNKEPVEGERKKIRRKILDALAPLVQDVKPVEGTAADAGSYRLDATGEGYTLKLFHRQPDENRHLEADLKFESLLEPCLEPGGAFEAVLLADWQGQVIYQKGAQHLGITDLAALVQEERRAQEEARQKREDGAEPLFGFSVHRKVNLAGRDYRLFVKPFVLPVRSPAVGPRNRGGQAQGQEEIWLLCGLVSESEHLYKGMAVSSALLTLLLALLVLALLSWPFVKLRLLGERQRVRLIDVLQVGICSLFGSAIVTVMVLDVFAFSSLNDQAERQAVELADELKRRLRTEIDAADKQLEDLEREAAQKFEKESQDRKVPKSASYPFWDNLLVLDDEGMQQLKWTPNAVVSALIPVARREYFQRALHDELWSLSREEPARDLYVESIVGWTTGERGAVVSKRTKKLGYPVAALAISMISLIDVVLPPGFEFVVLDSEDPAGRVLFHSDPGRNLSEHFFAETDQDRRLRSAVFARRSETMVLRYWGNDYIARVEPVEEMPWTVVALRDKRMLRSVNLEWIVTTVFFLLLYIGLVVFVLTLVVAARPSYRAGWLWPDRSRRRQYFEVLLLLLVLTAAFSLGIYAFPGGFDLFATSIILPFLALVIAYLRLGRSSARRPVAVACGCALLVLLGWPLLSSAGMEQLAVRWAILGMAGLTFAAAAALQRRRAQAKQPPAPDKTGVGRKLLAAQNLYAYAGLVLLVLTSVMPTLGFFESARRIQFESFVKHGQLRLALSLRERSMRVQRAARREMGENEKDFIRRRLAFASSSGQGLDGIDVYANPFFDTNVSLAGRNEPPLVCREERTRLVNGGKASATCPCSPKAESITMAELFEELLPRASEQAVEMRELMHRAASDCTWYWHPVTAGGELVLHSRISSKDELVLSSFVGRGGRGSGPGAAAEEMELSAVEGLLKGLTLLLLILLLTRLILFLGRNVFLLDLAESAWPAGEGSPGLSGRNLFLISRRRAWKVPNEESFFPIDLSLLRDTTPRGQERWRRMAHAAQDRDILVKGLGERLLEDRFQEKALRFLEELVSVHQQRVVVLSSVYPSRLFSSGPREMGSLSIEGRWQALLSSFIFVDDDLRSPEGAEAEAQSCEPSWWKALKERFRSTKADAAQVPESAPSLPKILREECRNNPFLLSKGLDLWRQPGSKSKTSEQLLEDFGDLAESYYRTLWANCSPEEEVVLEHLAEDGFVSVKNRRTIRWLVARGLIRRDPNLRLMNETFRRFVVSAICRSDVRAAEEDAEPSAWDRLRLPLFVGLATSLVFFFTTQQALLDGAAGAITGVVAGVPALIQVMELLGGRFPGMK